MKIIFVLLLIAAACVSCAQQKVSIKKMYAFNQLRFPGNIPVDDNGNPLITGPDTVIYIYIETSGTAPGWQNAIINGRTYAVSATPVYSVPVDIGISEQNGQPISISAGKESKLWQIMLSLRDAWHKIPPTQPSHAPEEIILEGTYNGKPFKKIIMKQVTLQPHESV